MSVLRTRQQVQPQTAVAVAGQSEPIRPAYNKDASASPIAGHMTIPVESTEQNAPVVRRAPRMNGMRYLYAHGTVRQPLQPLGEGPNLGVAVWSSEFQPDLTGPIHNGGFNDGLYQAGYPGWNLGLSFKVSPLPTNATGGPTSARMKPPPRHGNKVMPLRRPGNGRAYPTIGQG